MIPVIFQPARISAINQEPQCKNTFEETKKIPIMQNTMKPRIKRMVVFGGIGLALAVSSANAQSLINFYAQPAGTAVVSGPAVLGSWGDVWNGVTNQNGIITGAKDSRGNTTGISLSQSGVGNSDSMQNNGQTAVTVLLESSYWNIAYASQGPITTTITGLAANADYELVVYMTGRGANSGGTATWVDGTGTTIIGTAHCPANSQEASFIQGVNYARLIGQSDGSGKIVYTVTQDPASDAAWAWNGMQIKRSNPPKSN